MSIISLHKANCRKAALIRRQSVDVMVNSKATDLLCQFLSEYHGIPLSGYIPIQDEINPVPAMEEVVTNRVVGVPVVIGRNQALKFAYWTPQSSMKEGTFGVMIPVDEMYFEPEIVILPLLAFDSQGIRLGYGGGYYDRTLQLLRKKRKTLAIGFAYAAQEVDLLPSESMDQRLDVVVTEREIREFLVPV
ncbi:MAG: 5-formyltetrahydrofolate cyclo-ligase [Aestuariivita sp.]|nr:5-formyltetrahydrofolate cyclo-ligase [Aestuariivita sp.]